MMPFNTFFAAAVALTLIDVVTTVKGMKRANVGEANPILRPFFKKLGVRETLLIIKGAVLYFLYTDPPTTALSQWIILTLFGAVALNNLYVLKRTK